MKNPSQSGKILNTLDELAFGKGDEDDQQEEIAPSLIGAFFHMGRMTRGASRPEDFRPSDGPDQRIRRLVASVMRTALIDATHPRPLQATHLAGGKTITAAVRRDAWEWIQSESVDPMTFEWCCGVLDLDPEVVREKIQTRHRPIYDELTSLKGNARAGGG